MANNFLNGWFVVVPDRRARTLRFPDWACCAPPAAPLKTGMTIEIRKFQFNGFSGVRPLWQKPFGLVLDSVGFPNGFSSGECQAGTVPEHTFLALTKGVYRTK